MTSQGSASGRFQRALRTGSLFQAELAAREMGGLGLGQALALCQLLAAESDPRFERAAVRWHGRFAVERNLGSLAESQLLLSALTALPTRPEIAEMLEILARSHGVR